MAENHKKCSKKCHRHSYRHCCTGIIYTRGRSNRQDNIILLPTHIFIQVMMTNDDYELILYIILHKQWNKGAIVAGTHAYCIHH